MPHIQIKVPGCSKLMNPPWFKGGVGNFAENCRLFGEFSISDALLDLEETRGEFMPGFRGDPHCCQFGLSVVGTVGCAELERSLLVGGVEQAECWVGIGILRAIGSTVVRSFGWVKTSWKGEKKSICNFSVVISKTHLENHSQTTQQLNTLL